MTPKQRIANQLQALLERRETTPGAIERDSAKKGSRIWAVTIRRILKAEAEGEPDRATLRRIAEFLGEDPATAFPEPGVFAAFDRDDQGRVRLKVTPGIDPEQAMADLRAFIDGRDEGQELRAKAIKDKRRRERKH
jgi:transcriptional regulator with XRE-family HTH domain